MNFFLKEPLSILNLCNASVVASKLQVLFEFASTTIRLVIFIKRGRVFLEEGISSVTGVSEEETLGRAV